MERYRTNRNGTEFKPIESGPDDDDDVEYDNAKYRDENHDQNIHDKDDGHIGRMIINVHRHLGLAIPKPG